MQAVEAEPRRWRHGANLADMVAQLRASDAGSRELECLATGIYFESKSEPLAGQLAVGQGHRQSRRQPRPLPRQLLRRAVPARPILVRPRPCVCRRRRGSSRQWQTAVAIAKIVDQDLKESAVGDALFFHARYVSPDWRLKRVAAIGNHIFYR